MMECLTLQDGEVVLFGKDRDYLFFVNQLDTNRYLFHLVRVSPGQGWMFEFIEETHRFEIQGQRSSVMKVHAYLTRMFLTSEIDPEDPELLYVLVGGWLRESRPKVDHYIVGSLH